MNALPVTDALRRHQVRREQGVPTVTALVGPVGLGVRTWNGWLAESDRTGVCAIGDFLPAWIARLLTAERAVEQALAWVSAACGRRAEEVDRMTRYDLDALWAALPTDPNGPGAAAAFLVLTDRAVGRPTDPIRFAHELGSRAVRAVAELYPPERWPALLLTPQVGATADWVRDAARILERVAVDEPRLPVAIALTAAAYDQLNAAHADARAVALLREGFVEVTGVSRNQLEERLRAAGVESPPGAVDRLTTDGLADDVAEAFVIAVRSVAGPTSEYKSP